MTRKRIKFYTIFIIIFFSWVSFVSASVIVNEVQISPTEERFIELYNSSSSSVDLTDWYIQRKTANASTFGSLVSKTYFDGVEIGANDYLIISRTSINNADIIVDNLTLTESNTIQLKKSSKEIIDSLQWGSISEGKSLQRDLNGEWVSANPTPGTSNSSSSDSSDNSSEEYVVDEDTDSDLIIQDNLEILKITTKIISPKMVTVGIPFSISSLTSTNYGETYAVGRWIWNFGNGEMSEVVNTLPFDYIYEYPGEYVVTLSYFDSVFSEVADATNRITIKVIPADLYISNVGDINDPFIELENKSNYDIILSNWIVTGGIHYFKIPEGMILLPNKKIKLSPKITGFVYDDIKSIIITNPNKDIVSTYPIIKTQKAVQKSTSTYAIAQNSVSSVNNNSESNSLLEDSQVINLNDLGGSAEGSNIKIDKSTYAWMGFIIIIGLEITSFWLIKRRESIDDYIEKEIRAEDMTIIE